MEDNVYLCTWKQEKKGFALWPKSRPHLRVYAHTYAEAEELLIDKIQEAGGAMCAVLEFDPPLPKSSFQQKYANPELYLIHGDDPFETDAQRRRSFENAKEVNERKQYEDAFFECPVCRKCGAATSARNNKPLSLAYAPGSRFDGGFGYVGTDAGTILHIVSEDFIALLTVGERKRLQFRQVDRKHGGRSFFELVGPAGAPFVAIPKLEANGWRCTACGYRCWGYEIY